MAANLSEIVTTTLRNRSGQLADNVTENVALLSELRKKGNIRLDDGGRTIVQELDYAENGTFMYYSGFETLDITPSDVISAAEFDWKQAAVSVSISGLEQKQNAGKNAIIKLLKSRIKNAERTIMNNIGAGCYATGTGSGGKEIGGLQLLVADAPSSGTVGGIDRSTYSFWRNQVVDFTSDVDAGGSTSSNIQKGFNKIAMKLQRNGESFSHVFCDNDYFEKYLNSLQLIQRIVSSDEGDLGYRKLSFMGKPVICDGGYGGSCPISHAYFLNLDYLHFVTHKDGNFSVLGGEREPVDQDAVIKFIGWTGNMTLSNGFMQGLLKE